MNEHDVEALIAEALGNLIETLNEDEYADVPDGLDEVDAIRTFADAGVLSDNAGLVIRLGDGSEFQVSIVQSH